MIKLAPSILSANFAKLGDQVKEAEQAGAQWLHIDVMDGHFVPNITIGPLVVDSLRPISDMVFDVHLMIQHPLQYIESFAKAGADIITVHVECADDTQQCLSLIKKCGKKCGVVINPKTDVFAIEHLLDQVDVVLVMSVNPGFGGQSYIKEVEEKIKYLRERMGSEFDIEIDGGINKNTIQSAVNAGANIIVAGAAIFASQDGITAAVRQLIEEGNNIHENGNIS